MTDNVTMEVPTGQANEEHMSVEEEPSQLLIDESKVTGLEASDAPEPSPTPTPGASEIKVESPDKAADANSQESEKDVKDKQRLRRLIRPMFQRFLSEILPGAVAGPSGGMMGGPSSAMGGPTGGMGGPPGGMGGPPGGMMGMNPSMMGMHPMMGGMMHPAMYNPMAMYGGMGMYPGMMPGAMGMYPPMMGMYPGMMPWGPPWGMMPPWMRHGRGGGGMRRGMGGHRGRMWARMMAGGPPCMPGGPANMAAAGGKPKKCKKMYKKAYKQMLKQWLQQCMSEVENDFDAGTARPARGSSQHPTDVNMAEQKPTNSGIKTESKSSDDDDDSDDCVITGELPNRNASRDGGRGPKGPGDRANFMRSGGMGFGPMGMQHGMGDEQIGMHGPSSGGATGSQTSEASMCMEDFMSGGPMGMMHSYGMGPMGMPPGMGVGGMNMNIGMGSQSVPFQGMGSPSRGSGRGALKQRLQNKEIMKHWRKRLAKLDLTDDAEDAKGPASVHRRSVSPAASVATQDTDDSHFGPPDGAGDRLGDGDDSDNEAHWDMLSDLHDPYMMAMLHAPPFGRGGMRGLGRGGFWGRGRGRGRGGGGHESRPV